MRNFIAAAFATLVLTAAPPVFAQAKLGLGDPLPAQARQSVAKEWLSWFSALDRQVPKLSPSQEKWLKTEYQDEISAAGNRFTSRAIAASHSLEYQISVVKPRTAELIAALTQIANSAVRDRNHEVALWASICTWLVDYQYWQSILDLVDRGTVQKRIGHVDSLYFENYTLRASMILSEIVVPHLEGRLP